MSQPEIEYALPTAHTSGSSVYTAAAGISALSAVTRSASDAEPRMKEISLPLESELQRITKKPKSPKPAAAKQMSAPISETSCGIPSCSASGKAITNGLQNATSKQNGASSGIATM